MASGFLDLFGAIAARDPDRLFASFEGMPIRFGDLDRRSSAFAAALRRRGIARGARAALMLRNSPAALAIVLGLAKAEIAWVPVNVQQRGAGLRYILEHADPSLIVAEADLLQTVAESEARLPPLLLVQGEASAGEAVAPLLAGAADFAEPPPAPEACFAICYTSGTTGSPKGVMLSHAMLRYAGEAVALVSAARDGDTMLMWEPLYHIGGMQMLVLPLMRRVTLAMLERFSAGRFWDEARRYGASHIHFLGGILQILLKQPPSPLDREHGVRIAWGGGCPADVWRPFEQRFGVEIRECYGMTEAASITTFNATGVVGAVGRPVPWFEVELRDGEGRSVAAGEQGEIIVRAKSPDALFAGYFRNPEATAAALRDGVLHTGDLGRFD